jgi:hypothetical protein
VIAVMPIVGLYSQYALIKERKHIGSFSIDTCGILIVANVLRIMFWFSKGFANNLLVQSFVVLAMTVPICLNVVLPAGSLHRSWLQEEQQPNRPVWGGGGRLLEMEQYWPLW